MGSVKTRLLRHGKGHDDSDLVIDKGAMSDHSAVEVLTIGFEEFSPVPESIAAVRRFVRKALEPRGIDRDRIYECQLIADELATNAVRHAGTIFSVAIELTESFVRVAVRDDSDQVPIQRASPTGALSGRGLAIIDGTAGGWGTVPLGFGKETWADVHRRPG